MSQIFVVSGAVLLVFCVIWAGLWLEVLRDPKNELSDFYVQHPRTKTWVGLMNKLWVPALGTGVVFLIIDKMIGG